MQLAWPLVSFAIPFGGPLLALLWPTKFPKWRATYHFIKAHRSLDQNRPLEAWNDFKKCLESSENPHHFDVAAACLIVGLGRYREAIAVLARANALRAAAAEKDGIGGSSIRYLDPMWIAAFGHLAQLQYVIKLNILEGRKPEDLVLYIPPGFPIANRFMLEQWRPFVTIVDDERDLPLPLEKLRSLTLDFYAPRLANGETVYLWDAATRVNRRWADENRGPLLTLPPKIKQRGDATLASAGVPQGSWFVALHVREASSKKHHSDLHNVLNGDISAFLPAISEITSRGGYVIRIGDPSMTPLPPLPNVLDYCHSTIRSDWMDVYLLATCKFFLGSSSGPTYVPVAYGVPSVLTNWWPYAHMPWDDTTIFMPKVYRRRSNATALTLSQALAEPFGYCNSLDHLSANEGVIVENNSANDIRDATLEMIERLDGNAHYTADDLALRKKARYIFEIGDAHGTGTLARDFVRRNRAIVD